MKADIATQRENVKAVALLLVPPLLKVLHGPLFGPAMLVGAARRAGHRVRLLDLNACWLDEQRALEPLAPAPSPWLGDHDRPAALRAWETRYQGLIAEVAALPAGQVKTMQLSHREAFAGARRVAASPLAETWRRALASEETPHVVGISILYAGQVLSALALTLLARERWPRATIVWGGHR